MNERSHRLNALRAILTETEAESQEFIRQELSRHGFDVTQATLSRDLRTLRAAKVLDSRGHRYILPDHPLYRRTPSPSPLADYHHNYGFISISFSDNVAILHTRPGYAGGLASDIDAHHLPNVAGTLAGDDTILLIMTEGASREELIDELAELIPALKKK